MTKPRRKLQVVPELKPKSTRLFRYKGTTYPDYIRRGNGMQFVLPFAQQFCVGEGVDCGPGQWPFPGALPIDKKTLRWSVTYLPPGPFDYVFSSHCLEHLERPVDALLHWRDRLKPTGLIFLYLPHPDMRYWRPANCRKHLHTFWPADLALMLRDLGYHDVLQGERDLAWGYATVAYRAPQILMEDVK